MHTATLTVDVRDPQALRLRILFGETRREELACGREAIELQREFGTLTPHPRRLADCSPSNDANRIGFDR